MTRTHLVAWVLTMVASLGPVLGGEPPRESVRYVRLNVDKFVTECRFEITRTATGWSIVSTTERYPTVLEVEARYNAKDRLLAAQAILKSGDKAQAALVAVKDGQATIHRFDQESVKFDAPKGTIVTSAPDWTDVFLLCRWYDRQRAGKQEFPALWIHPTQAPLRLTFSIEQQGTDVIEHAGRKLELARFLIRIRNNSAYVAWADAQGRMIRLLSVPAKDATAGLTLAGFEKSAAGLRLTP